MADEVCCVCKKPCESDPREYRDRWSWGPDGMHCHFKCEGEFIRRYPHLVPKDHRPRSP